MFGFITSAFKAIGSAVGGAVGAVGHAIGSAVTTVASGAARLFSAVVQTAKRGLVAVWNVARPWLAKAAQVAALAGFTILTGGLGLPVVVALAASGFVGTFAASTISALLAGKGFNWGSILRQAAIGTIVALATAGVAKFVAPTVMKATNSVFGGLPDGIGNDISNAAKGALVASSAASVSNVINGRPLDQGLLAAVEQSALQKGVIDPVQKATDGVFGGLPGTVGSDVTNAANGALSATSGKVVSNVLNGRPFDDGLVLAAEQTALQKGVVDPVRKGVLGSASSGLGKASASAAQVTDRLPDPAPPEKATGMINALDQIGAAADGGSSQNPAVAAPAPVGGSADPAPVAGSRFDAIGALGD
ncbi:MAG TPA: hypothetical protein VFF73_25805 [Planctomycetota bacterium]|nr:hypothetical protein [Planctomycetota bacterium]